MRFSAREAGPYLQLKDFAGIPCEARTTRTVVPPYKLPPQAGGGCQPPGWPVMSAPAPYLSAFRSRPMHLTWPASPSRPPRYAQEGVRSNDR